MPRFSEDGYLPNTYYIPGKEQRIKEQIHALKVELRHATAAQKDIIEGRKLSLAKLLTTFDKLYYAKGRDTISHAEFEKLEASAAEWCESYIALMAAHDKAIKMARQLGAQNRRIAEAHSRREAIEQRIAEMGAAESRQVAEVHAQIAESKRLVAESRRLRGIADNRQR